MSLYNAIFGVNPLAPVYLSLLNLTTEDVGRFRDCFLRKTDDGEVQIIVYTRNGGGNRDAYEKVTELLRSHPHYITDYDNEFDSTYASYVFRLPPEFQEAVKTLAEKSSTDQYTDPTARFVDFIRNMENGDTKDPAAEKPVAPSLKKNE